MPQGRGSCILAQTGAFPGGSRTTPSHVPTDLSPFSLHGDRPGSAGRAPDGSAGDAGSAPRDRPAPHAPRPLAERPSRRPPLPTPGHPEAAGDFNCAPISLSGRESPPAPLHGRIDPRTVTSPQPSAPRREETHRARRLLLAARRALERFGGGPRPVVQAGEGVSSGPGRAAAAASARRREWAERQPGRACSAAGRRLGSLRGRRSGAEAPTPFSSEPQCLGRPFKTGRVAGYRQSHDARRSPRGLTRPALPAHPGSASAVTPPPSRSWRVRGEALARARPQHVPPAAGNALLSCVSQDVSRARQPDLPGLGGWEARRESRVLFKSSARRQEERKRHT